MNGALVQQLVLTSVALDADEDVDFDTVDALFSAAIAQGKKCTPDERLQLMDALGRVERALTAAMARTGAELSEIGRARRATVHSGHRAAIAGHRVSTRV